jgi:hypothetical protein
MRDWSKLLLIVCVVTLGAGMFVLERRISGLEAELRNAESQLAGLTRLTNSTVQVALAAQADESKTVQRQLELRYVTPANGETTRRVIVAPPGVSVPAPKLERRPSGEINGVPFYHNLLGQSDD